MYIMPEPGKTYEITIGGKGQTVAGKIIYPGSENGQPIPKGIMSDPRQVHAAAYQIEPEQKMPSEIVSMSPRSFVWLWQDAKNVYAKSKTFEKRFMPTIEDDGSFRFDDMPFGTYEFVVNLHDPLGENVGCGRGTLKAVSVSKFTVAQKSDLKPIKTPDIRMTLLTYPEIGAQAPSFEAQSVDGKTVRLKDFEGKVVLLDFWATWCSPCLEELPRLKELYKTFGQNKQFVMIGLSVDWDIEKAKIFVKSEHLDWLQLLLGDMGESIAARDYGIAGIPTTILLDGNGKIIAKNIRGEQLKTAIKQAISDNEIALR
jgi:peroxiredoxin